MTFETLGCTNTIAQRFAVTSSSDHPLARKMTVKQKSLSLSDAATDASVLVH